MRNSLKLISLLLVGVALSGFQSLPADNATYDVPLNEGFSWLGNTKNESGTLRVSLYCTHCLELLNEAYADPPEGGQAPKILLSTYGEKDKLSPLFVSAVLHSPGETQADRFLLPFSMIMQAYRSGGTFNDAMDRLRQINPKISETDSQAVAILSGQATLLQRLEDRGTPAYYLPNETLPRKATKESIFGITSASPLPVPPPKLPAPIAPKGK